MATKRLIDANATIDAFTNWLTSRYDGRLPRDIVAELPTVDAVEVVHGHWRYYSTTMQECSNCQRHTARHKFKYCPHCGAIMEDKYHESTD